MIRREFISLLGGTAVGWPLAARAQQPEAMPVIGFINPTSPDVFVEEHRAFHQALKETGYVEGDNVMTIYRWAEKSNRTIAGAGGRPRSPKGRRDRLDRRCPRGVRS